MAIVLVFVLGMGNFALHRAVLDSRHPLLARSPLFVGIAGRRAALALEFAVLLGALLLVANVHDRWSLAYLVYSALNAVAAWLILTRRL